MAGRSLSLSLYPILEYVNSLLEFPNKTPKLNIQSHDTGKLIQQLNKGLENITLEPQKRDSEQGSFSTDYQALHNFLEYLASKYGQELKLKYHFTPSKTNGIKSLDFTFPDNYKIDSWSGFATIGLTGIGGEFGKMLLNDRKYFLTIPNLVENPN